MSFRFNWSGFTPEFYSEALEMLTRALNKGGNTPPNLVGPIIAKDLDLGSTPPQLDILEISELAEDRFRAIFRMRYEGDGYLALQTQVQANPLRLNTSELPTMPTLGVVAAAAPLVVPMLLRISGLKLNGIVVLTVSRHDGVTLVFRSDPLVAVEVHSTFDSVPAVRRMLQREIEATLRTLFREDLPVIVHDMSVNEIRRARARKERERREHIEQQQQRIRRREQIRRLHSAPLREDSGAASVASTAEQHLMASQLHRRLAELSRSEELHRDSNSHFVSRRWSQPDMFAANLQSQTWDDTEDPFASKDIARDATLVFPGDDWERLQQSPELAAYRRRRDDDERTLDGERDGVVLRPADNAVAARLASLMNMGHTLSPYTRRFVHTTMRSDVNLPPLRFGHLAHHPAIDGAHDRLDADTRLLSDASSAGTPPPHLKSLPMSPLQSSLLQSLPMSPGSSMLHTGARQPSLSTSTSFSATSFSATSPPSGDGVRSPFSRNRVLRRKVHRIGAIPLGK